MPLGTQSTCSDAEGRGGRRQERFRLNASKQRHQHAFTLCQRMFHAVIEPSVFTSLLSICPFGRLRKKQDDSILVRCDNVHTARSSRTCTCMQGRQFSQMLAVRRRTGKCGAQHLVSFPGDRSVLLNVSTSKSTFTCCVDRDAKKW